MTRAFVLGLAHAVVVAAAVAQQPGSEKTVAVVVTAVADDSIYLDHGRDVGLRPGTLVRLFPPGAGEVEAEVRSVSQNSARVELPPGLPLPPVGTRGEARVAVVATGAPAPTPQRPNVPQHPPWTRREGERDPDQPLLVPTFGQRPEERPATFDGRWFGYGQWTGDRGGDSSSEYLLFRSGLRADAVNWLGVGERSRFAGEFDHRHVDVQDRAPETDDNARLDLASVAFGTEDYAPTGLEVGRFFSPHLPELGLVDGAEVVRRYTGGLRFGGGFGAYPRPFPARATGDDTGVHLFADWQADRARSAAAAIGLQKTWHRGAPDRDLVLLRGEWRPAQGMWLLGSAKLDWYTGSDVVKGSGLELTEAMLQSRWDGKTFGAGLTASRFTWPELKRAEYQALPADLVRDGFVDRFGWNGRWRASDRLSLRGRADVWRDQARDGTTFGLDGDWRGLWNDTSSVAVALFRNDGGYAAGPGARVTLRDRIGACSWRAGWRWYSYELDGLVTGPEDYVRQSIEVGLSCPLGMRGDLDLSAERWFGDREDAFALGFFVQWRF
ncbi:MAG: hypothetical protein JNK15_20635 [Planctomycetes bacterium]|nr:hypothetical protein [Planctomycetota bacterium]